jgi:hypothetical protein
VAFEAVDAALDGVALPVDDRVEGGRVTVAVSSPGVNLRISSGTIHELRPSPGR